MRYSLAVLFSARYLLTGFINQASGAGDQKSILPDNWLVISSI
jgi:hypothetical protein